MPRRISIRQSVMAADEKIANHLRSYLRERKILMINLIGSPGAGKTSLLEATLLEGNFRSAVIEGDIATSRDAERISRTGTEAIQINTHGGCHLEAHLVEKALEELTLESVDIIFIENVGNLVCPAEFDLGEDYKVAVCSVPEGPDKPLKYPHLFCKAGAVLLTKIDLSRFIPFDGDLFWGDVERLNPLAEKIEISATAGDGMKEWNGLLKRWLTEKKR